ncbi:hypothetical protein, partial [Pedobacter sp. Leaf216]|uniref:hypothetical protein n=1 Tax=Pedobacter sp. Leaf216 TaxID=1735684 RepID=UPI001F358AAF
NLKGKPNFLEVNVFIGALFIGIARFNLRPAVSSYQIILPDKPNGSGSAWVFAGTTAFDFYSSTE